MTSLPTRPPAGGAAAGQPPAGQPPGSQPIAGRRSRRALIAGVRGGMVALITIVSGGRGVRRRGAQGLPGVWGTANAAEAGGGRSSAPAAPTTSPGGISFRAASHAPARRLADKLGDVVSIRDFGAIGDGASHPVAEWLSGGAHDRGYRDLEAIRAAYPHVTGLSDEIDGTSIQAAVDHQRRRGGGDVCLPAGSYLVNRPIRLPLAATETNARQPKVNLLGAGENIVELRVKDARSGPAEFGATAADVDDTIDALKCLITFDWTSNPFAAADPYGARCACLIAGFSMRGPLMFQGAEEDVRAPFSHLCGIRVVDHVRLERLAIAGFYAALVIDGGQTAHRLVTAEGFYGAVLGRNRAHHGDMSWEKCAFSGTRAAWLVKPPAALMGIVFTSCFFSGQYGFEKVWKADESLGSHKDITLRTVTFIGGQFETIGASLVWTRESQGGVRRGRMSYVRFVNTALRKRPAAPGLDAAALFDVEAIDHCVWEAAPDFGCEFTAEYLFACRSVEGCVIRDADEFVSLMNEGRRKLTTPGIEEIGLAFEGGRWSGHAFLNSTAGGAAAPLVGDVVEQYFNRITAAQGRSPAIGIAMTAGESGSDRPLVVAMRAAELTVNLAPSQVVPPGLGAWLKPAGEGSPGKVVAAADPFDTAAVCQVWVDQGYTASDPTIRARLA